MTIGLNADVHARRKSWCICASIIVLGFESDMPATVISGHLRVCVRKARIKVYRLNWHWRVDDRVYKF